MPFQQLPTLPDYSKLVFMLNNSGVQKWNPAVYDILKNLIEAVKQSQDTFLTTVINNIVNTAISNIVTNSGGPILSVEFTINEADMQTMSTSPILLLAAQGVGTRIIPLICSWHTDLTSNAGANILATLRYQSQPTIDIGGPATLFESSTGSYDSNLYATQSTLANTVSMSNTGVILKGNGNTAIVGAFPPSLIRGTFYYILGSH